MNASEGVPGETLRSDGIVKYRSSDAATIFRVAFPGLSAFRECP